jgi:hypothetical protein
MIKRGMSPVGDALLWSRLPTLTLSSPTIAVMRSSILITLASLAAASAYPGPPPPPGPGPKYDFKRPGPHDSKRHQCPLQHPPKPAMLTPPGRGPCPMLNALANHGFFPRSGKNISIEQLVSGIDLALNLDPASSRPVAELAATTSTTGNPQTVNLADMAAHGGESPSLTQFTRTKH